MTKSLATRYRNLPVKHKLRLVVMVTVGAALVLACGAVLAYDQIAARESMRNDLSVLAEIFSANSTAALSFNDRAAAEELLSTLGAKQSVTGGFLYTPDGKLFARYDRTLQPGQSAAPVLTTDGSWFEATRLLSFKSIMLNGQKIGVVGLESDLEELTVRFRRFAAIILAILLGASLLALLLSSKLQSIILKPIGHLALVARTVSLKKTTPYER